MDPKLIQEREAFKRRAMAVPTIEKRKAKPPPDMNRPSKKLKPAAPAKDYDYKKMTGSSQFKFGILTKIVKYMKVRHQEGDLHPLNIDEILDETNQTDVNVRLQHWLQTEALPGNPKIETVNGNTYKFKPKYNVKDKKSLLRLLDKHDQNGLGGILIDDIEESLPNCQKVLKNLGDKVSYITRPDKKKVLYYNDKSLSFTVDEELQKMWRSATVEGVDERKIEEYLQKHGITSMQDLGISRAAPIQRRRNPNSKKNKNLKSHNIHMGDILQDYSNVSK